MEIQRESIFIASLRSFCKTIAVVIAVFIAFIPITFLFSFFGKDHELSPKTVVHILPDANGSRKILPESSPAILQIKLHGMIGAGELTNGNLKTILVDSQKGILKNERVRGVLLHINSPGGGVFDTDSMYRLLKEYKRQFQVPVFAYVDGLCASGAMYISCAADRIYSCPVGIIGSVGILMGPFFNFSDILGKWGVKSTTLTKGEDKDPMNPFRPWRADEGEELKNIMSYVYSRFVNIVTSARPKISEKDLINVYGAKIFSAQKALDLGYIDVDNANYNDALEDLVNAAGITQAYQVIELTPKSSWISNVISSSASSLRGLFQGVNNFSMFDEQFAYLYQSNIHLK